MKKPKFDLNEIVKCTPSNYENSDNNFQAKIIGIQIENGDDSWTYRLDSCPKKFQPIIEEENGNLIVCEFELEKIKIKR